MRCSQIFILVTIILSVVSTAVSKEYRHADIIVYRLNTQDGAEITLYRYKNQGVPLLLLHGMFENHLVFDLSNKGLARYLFENGFDVWILDLRSHDGDGDPLFDREHIDKYWDFDNNYLKIDLPTAIDFIKSRTRERIVIIGHSMGGYLGYAYIEVYGDENISALITIGSSGVAYEIDPITKLLRSSYGERRGDRIYVSRYSSQYLDLNNNMIFKIGVRFECFYDFKTSLRLSRRFIATLDREPAGVVVDMMYGFDRDMKNGHWVDPQTLYDYTENLSKIKVPVLLIAGSKDVSDKAEDVEKTFDLIGSESKTLHIIPGYGHLDLLLGKDSERDVYTKIKDWLNDLFLSE